MVASRPSLAVRALRPGTWVAEGSSELLGWSVSITRSRSAWKRVAMAHSTASDWYRSTSWSTTTTCLSDECPSKGGQDGGAAILRRALVDLHHGVQPTAAAGRDMHVATGADAADRRIDGGFARHAHEQAMLAPAGQQRLVDGVAPMGDALDDKEGLLAHEIARAREVEERPLVAQFLGEVALQHDLALGGDLQIEADGAHQRRGGQGVGDAELIDAGRGRHGRSQLHRQRRADAHRHRQWAARRDQAVCVPRPSTRRAV